MVIFINLFNKLYVIKKRFSNFDYGSKLKIIDWDSNSRGTFRLCEHDSERKYLTIYNDSKYDLFVSVANDENPQIKIDFEDYKDFDNLFAELFNFEDNFILSSFFDNLKTIKTLLDFFDNDFIKYIDFKNDRNDLIITYCSTQSFDLFQLNQFNKEDPDLDPSKFDNTSDLGKGVYYLKNVILQKIINDQSLDILSKRGLEKQTQREKFYQNAKDIDLTEDKISFVIDEKGNQEFSFRNQTFSNLQELVEFTKSLTGEINISNTLRGLEKTLRSEKDSFQREIRNDKDLYNILVSEYKVETNNAQKQKTKNEIVKMKL